VVMQQRPNRNGWIPSAPQLWRFSCIYAYTQNDQICRGDWHIWGASWFSVVSHASHLIAAELQCSQTGGREPWRRWSLCSTNFIRAHPTFGTTIFFANKSTDNSTSVQHLYCCLL